MAKKELDPIKIFHGHVYFIVGLIAAPMFLLSMVQAILTHVKGELQIALAEYIIAVMFFVIMWRSFARGVGHHPYP